MQEVAFAAYTNHPQGMEAGLEAVDYYDPTNLTFPFGSYICVVDIDRGTGEVKIRRFVAVDDCGVIINPMIVEGQIHGGLTMGLAPALYEQITYDDDGNIQGGTFMDYLLPTAMEVPNWETAKTTTPSPHHPIGAKGVGESATVGAPAAIANAVVVARGQAPGSAVEMRNTLDLAADGPLRTSLRWASDVVVSGMIASVGARLLQGAADKITKQVFDCIKTKLEAPLSAPTEAHST